LPRVAMPRIDKYIISSFISGCLPVMLLLLSLFSFLSLAEELEDVGMGAYRLADAFLVVMFTLPSMVVDLLPVTLLLGGLLGLGALANQQELIAMRAAGLSPARIVAPVMKLSMLLIGVVLIVQTWLIPMAEHHATQLRAKSLLDSQEGELSEIWTRSQDQFIRIGKVKPGRLLADVEIYQFDNAARLVQMFQTETVELLDESTWLMHRTRRSRLEGEHAETVHEERLVMDNLLSDEQAKRLFTPARSLAPVDLWRFIARLEENRLSSRAYRVMFWNQLGISLGVFAMTLLSLAFLFGSVRSVTAGQRVIQGGLFGMGYYLAQQIVGHVTLLLELHVPATVLAPGLTLLVLALVLIRRAN
jgi:lipopolysaccharide export system permease protein